MKLGVAVEEEGMRDMPGTEVEGDTREALGIGVTILER